MAYEIERPDGSERGVRVTCTDHGTTEEFHPAERRVTFHCPDCAMEVEVALHDLIGWQDRAGRC